MPEPVNSFLLFCKDRREPIANKNPGLSNCDVTKILAKQWKELNPFVKDEYRAKSYRLKQEFKYYNPNYSRKKKNSNFKGLLFNFKVSVDNSPAPIDNSTRAAPSNIPKQRRSCPEVMYNPQLSHQQFHSNERRESYPENTYPPQRMQQYHPQPSYNSYVNTFQRVPYNPHVSANQTNYPSFDTFDEDLNFLDNIFPQT